MPRRDFQRDVAQACLPGSFARLTDLKGGTEDGSITFTYTSPSTSKEIEIQVTVPDTSEYPRNHQFFAFTVTEKVPDVIPFTLEAAQPSFAGLSVDDFLAAVSDCLDHATTEVEPRLDRLQLNKDEDENSYGAPTDDDMDWELDDEESTWSANINDESLEKHIKSDMRKAWDAGYLVSYRGELNGPVILTVACLISKLGISHEAMQAWGVKPEEYLILLIRYPQGFRPLTEIVDHVALGGTELVQMHVGICEFYKPSFNSTRDVFALNNKKQQSYNDASTAPTTSDSCPPLKPIFIEKTLHSLLNERFIHILKCRFTYGFSWTGAELYVKDGQGRRMNCHDCGDEKYYEPEKWDTSSPSFLAADHLTDTNSPSDLSFLLIAMQFTLRRFVKCTEFCLNCYCKIDTAFEALKPFVCSSGLCLYQYITLGMGPNLEWEISTQPYVIDLLVNFAYARASSRKLEDFPTGLGLKVPHPFRKDLKENIHEATLTIAKDGELYLQVKESRRIKRGDWVVIMMPSTPSEIHVRVKDDSNWPDIYLSSPIFRSNNEKIAWSSTPYTGPVTLALYETNLDLLTNNNEKLEALIGLLDTLPTVIEMRSFIEDGRVGYSRPLASWEDRITPSALYVLQWIVGSNRSCIMYDDDPQKQVSGMDGYVQFRLAQGAPDKEERFVASVTSVAARLKLQYPTLFTWHGSALDNWHSILREGLHFKNIVNGRSCGNGVYMSSHFNTSSGYSARTSVGWPNGILRCSTAISLNEVVNAPTEFVCNQPHLVVQHLDWIQPRYLFVQCRQPPSDMTRSKPQKTPEICMQDPDWGIQGPNGAPIQIPVSGMMSRFVRPSATSAKKEKQKSKTGKRKLVSFLSDAGTPTSDRTRDAKTGDMLAEDLEFLLSDSEPTIAKPPPKLETDFSPGSLQASTLKLLGQPTYANPTATKILRQQLRLAMDLQDREPLHELGWYIDPNLANNLYQWIVELHSFDPTLPLARDLKSTGLTSVVLEMRFPAQFPLSPPFVRIIRPRFLRFSNGGGGHITAGGSMCMELLTNSGWSAVASIESVLLQVRMAISNTQPQPARLDTNHWNADYTVGEAVSEYKRVCNAHGWTVPDDISQVSWS